MWCFRALCCGMLYLMGLTCAIAQTDQEEIMLHIEGLFDAMRELDQAGFSSHFTDTAYMQSFQSENGALKEQSGTIADFVKSFDRFGVGDLDERIDGINIEVDRYLAIAWVPYQFYYKGALHHCGTNVMEFVKAHNVWKINRLVDTHYEDCAQGNAQGAKEELDSLLNNWHRAAAQANAQVYFNQMRPGGFFIGTDASENWPIDSFQVWSQPYFDKGKAWDFKPMERNIYFSNDRKVAWFDELLQTWMGVCRGSGVLELEGGRWVLKQYVLSVTVPNEEIEEFLKIGKQ